MDPVSSKESVRGHAQWAWYETRDAQDGKWKKDCKNDQKTLKNPPETVIKHQNRLPREDIVSLSIPGEFQDHTE